MSNRIYQAIAREAATRCYDSDFNGKHADVVIASYAVIILTAIDKSLRLTDATTQSLRMQLLAAQTRLAQHDGCSRWGVKDINILAKT